MAIQFSSFSDALSSLMQAMQNQQFTIHATEQLVSREQESLYAIASKIFSGNRFHQALNQSYGPLSSRIRLYHVIGFTVSLLAGSLLLKKLYNSYKTPDNTPKKSDENDESSSVTSPLTDAQDNRSSDRQDTSKSNENEVTPSPVPSVFAADSLQKKGGVGPEEQHSANSTSDTPNNAATVVHTHFYIPNKDKIEEIIALERQMLYTNTKTIKILADVNQLALHKYTLRGGLAYFVKSCEDLGIKEEEIIKAGFKRTCIVLVTIIKLDNPPSAEVRGQLNKFLKTESTKLEQHLKNNLKNNPKIICKQIKSCIINMLDLEYFFRFGRPLSSPIKNS